MELAQPPARSLALGLILQNFNPLLPESSWASGISLQGLMQEFCSPVSSSAMGSPAVPGRPGCPASLWWGKCTLSPWAATLAA